MSITILDCYRRVLRMTKVASGRLDMCRSYAVRNRCERPLTQPTKDIGEPFFKFQYARRLNCPFDALLRAKRHPLVHSPRRLDVAFAVVGDLIKLPCFVEIEHL